MAECGLPVTQAVWRSPASTGVETTSKSVTESSPRQVQVYQHNISFLTIIILSAEAAPQLRFPLVPALWVPGPDLHCAGRGHGGGGAGAGHPE